MKFKIVSEIDNIETIQISIMRKNKNHFAVCIDNTEYEVSVIPRKVYEVIRDDSSESEGYLRIIDESGDDYLYHNSHFMLVEFPVEVERRLVAVAA